MFINGTATTTNMLLSNINGIIQDLAPMINILAGIFLGFWLLDSIIRLVGGNKRRKFRDEQEEYMGGDLSKEQEEDKI